jgi:hypothetical protein
MRVRDFVLGLSLVAVSPSAFAIADGVLCTRDEPCNARGLFTRASAGPTKSDAIRVNPAAVPVEKITGIETIYYKDSFDFGFVKGLGRVGAAISPSNNDETFFGAPAAETDTELLERMFEKRKLKTDKYTFAVGINLFTHKGRGLAQFSANLGVMARYFASTSHVTPGAGLQLLTGPLLFGAAIYEDENQIVTDPTLEPESQKSPVATWNAALSLESFMFDYSVIETAGAQPATASVATLTAFLGKRAILTASRREVNSDKPAYSFKSKSLIAQEKKTEWFGGAQYRVAPFLVLGVYYNYYLLHEPSASAIFFF